MKHRFENHDLTTTHSGQLVDLTADVEQAVAESGVVNGLAVVYTPHTTCAVLINERESGFTADFSDVLEGLIPRAGDGSMYRHDDLEIRTEGLDGDPHETPNGHSHCRAALIGSSSQSIPIVEGELRLGRWQKVFLCELDHSRERKVFIQVLGE
jgi:secondary thiamine-phosphate synthase enzyme